MRSNYKCGGGPCENMLSPILRGLGSVRLQVLGVQDRMYRMVQNQVDKKMEMAGSVGLCYIDACRSFVHGLKVPMRGMD